MQVEGENYRAMQTYERAAELAKEKLEVNNLDWRTLGHLASYLTEIGNSEEAMTAAQSALQLSGRRPEALFRATMVYCHEAYTDTCFSLLEEMVEKDASYRQFVDTTDTKLKDLNPQESNRFQAIIATP